jgi:hypothetical protein
MIRKHGRWEGLPLNGLEGNVPCERFVSGGEEGIDFYREGSIEFDDAVIVAAGQDGDFTKLALTIERRFDGGGGVVEGEFAAAGGRTGCVRQTTGLLVSHVRSF